MVEEFKHLRVKTGTHKKVKAFAAFKGISITEAVEYLLKQETNKGVKNVADYRRR